MAEADAIDARRIKRLRRQGPEAPATAVGILSLFDHYPALRPGMAVDRRLVAALGLAPGVRPALHLVDVSAAAVLPAADLCDLWVVSGAPIREGRFAPPPGLDAFLAQACAQGRPVYGLNHGEHALHAALCPDAPSPATPRWPRAVRNPFVWFGRREALFLADPAARAVRRAAPQPARAA